MKTIMTIMIMCLILAVASFLGELLFGTGVEADGIREFIKAKI